MAKFTEGLWMAWIPWVRRRHSWGHGRDSSLHIVAEDNDHILIAVCGKTAAAENMYDHYADWRPEPTKDNSAWELRRYCGKCLKSVGIEREPAPRRGGRARDSQRQRVYKSEWKVEGGLTEFVARDIDEAQFYVDTLMELDWWQETFPLTTKTPVRCRRRRGSPNRGHANAREIALGARALGEYMILHELAHTVHHRLMHHIGPMGDKWITETGLDHSGHGQVYVGILLALVAYALGEEKADTLRASFRAHNVKWIEWAATPKPWGG